MSKTDIAIIGGGINGASTALELAKNGVNVTLLDKHSICRGASGVNAGTLTMHMTRAQLIPYAKKGWELWMSTNKWLSKDIDVEKRNGLCLAFTEDEEKLLNERSKIRKEYGADIKIISKKEALRIDPNILDTLLHPTLDDKVKKEVIASGLPASPGAAAPVPGRTPGCSPRQFLVLCSPAARSRSACSHTDGGAGGGGVSWKRRQPRLTLEAAAVACRGPCRAAPATMENGSGRPLSPAPAAPPGLRARAREVWSDR